MAWYWGEKTKRLALFISAQANDIHAWGFTECRARHLKSRTEFWISGRFWGFDVMSEFGELDAGFSLMQKWKLHRKLNKLKQKLEKQQKANKTSVEDQILEKMVVSVWGTPEGKVDG